MTSSPFESKTTGMGVGRRSLSETGEHSIRYIGAEGPGGISLASAP